MSTLITKKEEADELLANFKKIAQQSERYIQDSERPHPDLVAVMRGLRQTRIGRDVYFEAVEERRRDFERRVAKKKEQAQQERAEAQGNEQTAQPSRRDLLRMKKADLIEFAEAVGVDTSGKREEIVERLENAGLC